MSTRTSNKQILEAIEKLTETIANAMVPNQTVKTEPEVPTLTPISQPTAEAPAQSVKVAKGYLNHMVAKTTATAKEKGVDYMLYARFNKAGETKLAYTTLDRWSKGLRDSGLIGPIQIVKAS